MSSQLVSANAGSASPNWTPTELEALSNSPGDNALSFIVHAYSPKYLGSGTDIEGQLLTQTAVAKIAAVGGTPTFSNLSSFGDTISTRQMQGSISSQGWFIVASYDSTNGTRVKYTTNNGSSWSSYVTVSSGVNGSGHMPALWMSQKTAGLAVVTGFAVSNAGFGGSNDTPTGANTWRRRFIIDSTNGAQGWTIEGTLSANGVDFQLDGSPNAHSYVHGTLDLPAGCTVTGMYFKQCSNPFRVNEAHYVYASGTQYAATLSSNCVGSSSKSGLTASADGNFGWYAYDQRPYISGYGADDSYSFDFNLEGTGTNPFGAISGAAAFVTTDYGATWAEITSAATVGYIQPGTYLSGAMDAPYTDATPQRFVYGSMDTGGTYPVPRLHRVSGTTTADISPVADSKTYGVPYDEPSMRAVFISVTDAGACILCGESRDATTGDSVFRVFRTPDVWASTVTWTPLTAESSSIEWVGGYFSGSSANFAHFLGADGSYGTWSISSPSIVVNRKGDSTKSSKAVGLAGL